MAGERMVPPDPVAFIQRCVRERRIYWTYHVNIAAFHVLFAVDCADENVRVVTAYHPDPVQWNSDFKTRRTP